eukprot:CAMPEP_0170274244 /NCGR_PEP_ID=MMETSP0116_2-20130129/37092_1 /TAXON_ID=400756 /ORGANISM="Durinskia baltica, Strain CSIRO CS-38" /LENGTH=128 /DNA_ID=CAMNT_0010525487 /DNA_START=315 /DNA_END=701 /DNA_ORIENTATION=+
MAIGTVLQIKDTSWIENSDRLAYRALKTKSTKSSAQRSPAKNLECRKNLRSSSMTSDRPSGNGTEEGSGLGEGGGLGNVTPGGKPKLRLPSGASNTKGVGRAERGPSLRSLPGKAGGFTDADGLAQSW